MKMSKQKKNKKRQMADNKPFDVGVYELFNNKLYKYKVIPNKKKVQQLKRKKVDINDYLPFIFARILKSYAHQSLC